MTEQFLKGLLDGVLTGSPAVCAIFACLWWLERQERKESHKALASFSERLMAITHVLGAIKERLR